ncbi:MAG: bifunctional [glutamine synthetase] adenylyltransferase/[glutamine synthetase]-adenylyl-L-tyrosine phosphorylase, partial [Rhizobiaceae bacterium]|nr:bifunctional [glutamine synthetase] adenylyltransferase/[glutamine synthetase]-adenylyl-L-tyrosine phosphorylase [Rhizobiaceae bacterium]
DVDLILLYDHDVDADESDGPKPLAPSHYYARLTQRLIAAVSAPTAEGTLYELDLRLRPSGNKGPVATHIEAFRKYQREEAWTWEQMALTRARPVAGDQTLARAIDAEIVAVFEKKRQFSKIAQDAVEMRALIEEEKPPKDFWDIKLTPGGLIDLEFIAQVARLTGKLENMTPTTSTAQTLRNLAPSFASDQVRSDLVDAYSLYLALTQMIRLCLIGPFDRDDVPKGLADLLLRVADLPDFSVLEAHLQETSQTVREHFDRLLRPKG